MQDNQTVPAGYRLYETLSSFKKLVCSCLLSAGCLLASPTVAEEFRPPVRSMWVYDIRTKTVMFSQNADVAMAPASMTKLMTLYVLFEALKEGRVQPEDHLPVSAYAASRGGSTMFLDTRDSPTISELIQGIVVMSGNDAAIVVAEGLSGTEEAFAQQMNNVAVRIGMRNTHFENASGWPEPRHVMTAHDLGRLAIRLIEDFPQYYRFFSQAEFAFDNRAPANRFNRNPILGPNIGGDGLKTGHTEEAGYGLVGSVLKDDRRVVFAFMGAADANARSQVARETAAWAYGQFRTRTVVRKGDLLTQADVWLGERQTVPLTVQNDLSVLIPVASPDELRAEVSYFGPITAPIQAGQEVGHLEIERRPMQPVIVPVVTSEDIAAGGFGVRLEAATKLLVKNAADFVATRLVQKAD